MVYRLTMFGPPALVDETGEAPSGLGPGKPLAVLCYLAREGEVRRETVTAMLWGDTTESKARNAFRQALHRLRSALGEEMIPHDPDTVRIAGTADLWIDVDEFERALAEGQPGDAVELVAGDFLEGFTLGEPGFDHWADGERARLRGRFLAALREAVGDALAEGRVEEALLHARRLTKSDPLDSSAAVLEAKTLTAAGRGEEARRLLEEHARRYLAEVGDEPPEEVAAALAGFEADDGAHEPDVRHAAGEPTLRPEALQTLLAAWREVVGGESDVVLLEGEAGTGKTWLLDELHRRIRPLDRPLVLRGTERMGRHGLPYVPVAEALRGVLRARGLAGASTHLLAEAARLLPELRDRFDLPVPPPITDRTGQLRLYEGVASVLDAVAFEQPVLLALEGLEASDEPTLELIHFLTSRLRDSSILFVLSYEPGGGRPVRERYEDRGVVIHLGPVDPERIEGLLEARFPGMAPDARSEVAAACDGRPGRALELVERRERGEAIAGPPARRDDVLRSRLAGRTPGERRILLVLALVGRSLTVRLVAAATHLPEGAVLEAVGPLRAAGLLRERDHGVELPDDAVGRLVLETAGDAATGLIAGWALEALAAERAGSDAELARLAMEAGRSEEASRYAEAAGRTAAGLGAHELAREHLRRALEWTTDPVARARIERLLAGAGEGGPQLAAGAGSAEPRTGSATGAIGWRTRLGLLVAVGAAIVLLIVFDALDVPGRNGSRGLTAPDRVVRDTLVLVRTDPGGARTRLAFTGNLEAALASGASVIGSPSVPRWIDSLRAVGVPVLVSPDDRWVAMERSVDGAPVLMAVSADRSVMVPLDSGAVRFDPLGWGPEATRLLYRRVEDGGNGDLWAVRMGGGEPIAIDTTGRDVVEAAWSPTGTRVAWTARPAEQSEGADGRGVFVAFADGTEARRLTDDDTHDYHLAWAPDGERVAFTSERSGSAEIYAVEVETGRLWRLTWNENHDDRAAFSPDGDYLAFESIRDGEPAVYVMSSWGGQPVRVTGEGQLFVHDGWRGYPPPHLSHLRIRVPDPLDVGERGRVVVEPVYSDYVSRSRGSIRWRALDPDVVDLAPVEGPAREPGTAMTDTVVVARAPGLGRLLVSAGGWRTDTVYVKVGAEPIRLSGADLEAGLPLSYGLRVSGRLRADPFGGPSRVALLAPQPSAQSGQGRPVRVASLEWWSDGRVVFRVEREEHTESLGTADGSDALRFDLVVGENGHVEFSVRDRVRWRSTLRVTGTALALHRVRLRVEPGGRVAEDLVAVVGGQ